MKKSFKTYGYGKWFIRCVKGGKDAVWYAENTENREEFFHGASLKDIQEEIDSRKDDKKTESK